MSKLKKVLLMCTAYVLVAALAIGGTIAYLQDSDSDVNVMTLGNVKIEQHEYQRAEGVAHDAGDMGAGNGVKEGALVPFVQGQALYPAVPSDATAYTAEQDTANQFFWGEYVYTGTAGNGLWNDDKLSNVMDKMVFVENTGKSDAYFRTIIAFECPEGMAYSQGSDKEFMMNANIVSYSWDNAGDNAGYIEINGTRYYVLVATYKNALNPGNQSHPSLLQVVMTHNATNEDMEKLGDTYEILVLSQAVQTAGFADAKTALDTAFGKATVANVQEWFGDEKIPVVVSDAAELNAVIAAGGSAVLSEDVEMEAATTAPYRNKYGVALNGGVLDGNGNELEIECYGDDYGIMTTGGTVKNLTIKEGCRAVMIMYATEDIILDNVNIGGDGVLYAINTGETGPNGSAGIDLIVTNSTIKGWTSYGDAIESASFTNVSFGQGTYYNNIYGRVLKPYVNTTLTDCSFIEHMNLDLSALKEGHKVTIENCTVNGQAVTADVFTIPSTDEEYDTEPFTVDLPSWATSISDCIIFK